MSPEDKEKLQNAYRNFVDASPNADKPIWGAIDRRTGQGVTPRDIMEMSLASDDFYQSVDDKLAEIPGLTLDDIIEASFGPQDTFRSQSFSASNENPSPIEIREENFPLYQLIMQTDNPVTTSLRASFNQAASGGDEEKFGFAFGLQTIATQIPTNAIPGFTAEVKEKTLASCLDVFNDVASRGHQRGAFMAQYFVENGLGKKPEVARKPKKKSFRI